jgi:hypothetical protein
MKTWLCKKIVAKFKELKAGCSNFPRRLWLKKGCFANDDDDDDDAI